MFSKPQNPPPAPPAQPNASGAAQASETQARAQASGRKASLIAADLKIEGNITGGAEVQIDGSIVGDVRVERVTVGEGGHVDGGVFAEAVEVRGRVSGSITAKQVRLFGPAHVEGDITHEQLAIETGAYFQGRSLRLQRAAPEPQILTAKPVPVAPRADAHEPVEVRSAPLN